MRQLIDLTGSRFHRLTVLGRAPNWTRETGWFVRCDCGKEKRVRASNLKSGRVQSCGCFHREELVKRNTRPQIPCTRIPVEGVPWRRLHGVWRDMNRRCHGVTEKKNDRCYRDRGITVCDRWRNNFHNFYNDMAPTWADGLTLERSNNDLGYSPENCRWATMLEQSNNQVKNVFLEYEGKRMTISQWAREKGIQGVGVLHNRIKGGWSVERALDQPVLRRQSKNKKAPPVKGVLRD